MAYEYYTMQLGAGYVLSLFQGALDDIIEHHRPDLDRFADCIMDWYEDQLKYDELDWEIESIPALVWSDIMTQKLVCIDKGNAYYNTVAQLYDQNGIGSVDTQIVDDMQPDYVPARFCYVAKDNDGDDVYIIQEQE